MEALDNSSRVAQPSGRWRHGPFNETEIPAAGDLGTRAGDRERAARGGIDGEAGGQGAGVTALKARWEDRRPGRRQRRRGHGSTRETAG